MSKFTFTQVIVLLATSWITCINSFNISAVMKPRSFTSSSKRISDDSSLQKQAALGMSSSSDANPSKPDLIDQSLFVSAIDVVKAAAAEVNGVEYVKQQDAGYAIGRIQVNLGVPPSIDLVETPQLVLINGVSPDARDAGIQTLDTIISVSTGTFQQKTKALNMDDTVSVIKAAIAHARENDSTEIQFELNRLLGGYYK
uniref:Uncharacterized protein n=1 Tax=Eucampia antarctica TaxID=49252 RepID=A0A7S2W0Y7_9STRA|mmetsp:Transcript_17037/g.16462  ORF Transcript_17037/g.16462 Transcript_17037/m.16462 type:complete len:199 (+) Transcript_17037:48-644(+)